MGRHGRKTPRQFFNWDLIFTRRDPRDILVSNWYLVTQRHRTTDMSLDRFVQQRRWGVQRMVEWYRCWSVRLRYWRKRRRVHLWTYEEAHSDPVREFGRLARAFGLDGSVVEAAVEASSFERMQEVEVERGGLIFPDTKFPVTIETPEAFMIRKGCVGEWKRELSQGAQDHVNAHLRRLPLFMARYRDEIAKNG
jgi:hypothetical protein